MLAAQLSGAAYVPLDPASPEDRLASILESVELSGVLTDDHNRARFASPLPIATGASFRSLEVAPWHERDSAE
jgi:non-ribosomal peptide synthetase component F